MEALFKRLNLSRTPAEPITRILSADSLPKRYIPNQNMTTSNNNAFPNQASISSPERSTFHQFTQLPYEIRLQIWRLAIFEPRIITPRKVLCKKAGRRKSPFRPGRLVASCPPCPPAAFSVCSETRKMATSIPYLFTTGCVRLYFNPAVDTLYFHYNASIDRDTLCTPDTFTTFAPMSELKSLKRIFVSSMWLHCLYEPSHHCTGDPESFRNQSTYKYYSSLEEIFLTFTHLYDSKGDFHSLPDSVNWMSDGHSNPHCEVCLQARKGLGGIRGWKFPLLEEYQKLMKAQINLSALTDEFWEREWRRVLYTGVNTRTVPQSSLGAWMWKFIHDANWGVELTDEDIYVALEELYSPYLAIEENNFRL